MDTGITFGEFPGIINPYHEIAACNAANYRYFHDWQELTSDEQAILVTHYLSGIMIENHKQDALNVAMKKQSRKNNKGKK